MKNIVASILIMAFLMSLFTVAKAEDLTCRYLHTIEQGYLNNHIKFKSLTPDLETRLIEQYIKRLDSSKIYFLKSDVTKIKELMKGIFAKIEKNDCSPLDKVQTIYKERVKERMDYATKALNKKFKLDSKTEFVYDPEERQFATSNKVLNKFQDLYLQFQVANYVATDMSLDESRENVVRNYERLLRRINEMKNGDILSAYLDSFARALDPHSSYFAKDVLEDFEIQMRLSLEGIGATLSSQDGFTVIEQLVVGGAADRSGELLPQDKIVAVGQDESGAMENVIEMDLRDVVRKIRGPKGTKVRLAILRKTSEGKQRFMVTLTRDKVNLEDDAAQVHYIDKEINGEKKVIAVINLPSFYADARRGGRSCAEDVKKLFKEVRNKGAHGVVLDLSTNGGGSLDDAVKLAGLFFKTGNVVKQSSRGPFSLPPLKDTDKEIDFAGPLVVLTSRISASASEIVAGALQDYKRAVIVGGDHTFGKGSVQSVVTLPVDGLGAIKVTVGMFYIPGGKSTQHIGVTADVPLPGIFSTKEVGEKSLDYSLPEDKVASFISQDAFDSSWNPVDPKMIESLKKRSSERVTKSEEFKKIVDDMKKAEEKGKVIKVSEILKDKDAKEKKEKEKALKANKEERVKEYLKKADLQESVNVVTDMIQWQMEHKSK